MLETGWAAADFVARLDAGEFDGHITEAVGALSPDQLREVEWILLHNRTSEPKSQRVGFEDLKPNGRLN